MAATTGRSLTMNLEGSSRGGGVRSPATAAGSRSQSPTPRAAAAAHGSQRGGGSPLATVAAQSLSRSHSPPQSPRPPMPAASAAAEVDHPLKSHPSEEASGASPHQTAHADTAAASVSAHYGGAFADTKGFGARAMSVQMADFPPLHRPEEGSGGGGGTTAMGISIGSGSGAPSQQQSPWRDTAGVSADLGSSSPAAAATTRGMTSRGRDAAGRSLQPPPSGAPMDPCFVLGDPKSHPSAASGKKEERPRRSQEVTARPTSASPIHGGSELASEGGREVDEDEDDAEGGGEEDSDGDEEGDGGGVKTQRRAPKTSRWMKSFNVALQMSEALHFVEGSRSRPPVARCGPNETASRTGELSARAVIAAPLRLAVPVQHARETREKLELVHMAPLVAADGTDALRSSFSIRSPSRGHARGGVPLSPSVTAESDAVSPTTAPRAVGERPRSRATSPPREPNFAATVVSAAAAVSHSSQTLSSPQSVSDRPQSTAPPPSDGEGRIPSRRRLFQPTTGGRLSPMFL